MPGARRGVVREGRNVGCRWKQECRLGCVVTLHTSACWYNKPDPRGRRRERRTKHAKTSLTLLCVCVCVCVCVCKMRTRSPLCRQYIQTTILSGWCDKNYAVKANTDGSSWLSLIHSFFNFNSENCIGTHICILKSQILSVCFSFSACVCVCVCFWETAEALKSCQS